MINVDWMDMNLLLHNRVMCVQGWLIACVGGGDLIESDFKREEKRIKVKEAVLNVLLLETGLVRVIIVSHASKWTHIEDFSDVSSAVGCVMSYWPIEEHYPTIRLRMEACVKMYPILLEGRRQESADDDSDD